MNASQLALSDARASWPAALYRSIARSYSRSIIATLLSPVSASGLSPFSSARSRHARAVSQSAAAMARSPARSRSSGAWTSIIADHLIRATAQPANPTLWASVRARYLRDSLTRKKHFRRRPPENVASRCVRSSLTEPDEMLARDEERKSPPALVALRARCRTGAAGAPPYAGCCLPKVGSGLSEHEARLTVDRGAARDGDLGGVEAAWEASPAHELRVVGRAGVEPDDGTDRVERRAGARAVAERDRAVDSRRLRADSPAAVPSGNDGDAPVRVGERRPRGDDRVRRHPSRGPDDERRLAVAHRVGGDGEVGARRAARDGDARWHRRRGRVVARQGRREAARASGRGQRDGAGRGVASDDIGGTDLHRRQRRRGKRRGREDARADDDQHTHDRETRQPSVPRGRGQPARAHGGSPQRRAPAAVRRQRVVVRRRGDIRNRTSKGSAVEAKRDSSPMSGSRPPRTTSRRLVRKTPRCRFSPAAAARQQRRRRYRVSCGWALPASWGTRCDGPSLSPRRPR